MDNNNSKKKDGKSSIEYDIDYDFISGEKFDSSEDELTFNDTQSVNNSTDRSYSYDFTEGIPASAAAPPNSAEPATAATPADDISSNVKSPENNIDIAFNQLDIFIKNKDTGEEIPFIDVAKLAQNH